MRLSGPATILLRSCLALVTASGALTAGQSWPSATTRSAAVDQQRASDLLALIEGPNSGQTRRTGARELLRLDLPDLPQRIVAILSSPNEPARLAMAQALAEQPEHLRPEYIEPLAAMLSSASVDVRRVACDALAGYADPTPIPVLRRLLLDPSQGLGPRLAAVQALSEITTAEAVAALVEALDEPQSAVATAALEGIERVGRTDFQGDPELARRWWSEARHWPPGQWQRLQLRRLAQENREYATRIAALESRLGKSLRDSFLRAGEADRPALLHQMLTDPLASVRLIGLELVQSYVSQGKTLPAESLAVVHSLLKDSDPAVRAGAVRGLASLRDPATETRFLELLATERHTGVLAALLNGLGHVGGPSAIPALLPWIDRADVGLAGEAVSAVGRLAERGVIPQALRSQLSDRLLALFRQPAAQSESVFRERLVWAMARLGDPRLAPTLTEILGSREPIAVRLAAARGIGLLAEAHAAAAHPGTAAHPATRPTTGNPGTPIDPAALADALIQATADSDPGLRKTALEALGHLAVDEPHLRTLWEHAFASGEADEAVRESAWQAVLRVLETRPPSQTRRWLEQLPKGDPLRAARELDLLLLLEKGLSGRPDDRATLGEVRWQIARARAALGRSEEALSSYLTALVDLAPQRPGASHELALELARFALLAGRYSPAVQTALREHAPTLSITDYWDAVRRDIETTPAPLEQKLQILAEFRQLPPAELTPPVAQALSDLEASLLAQRREGDARQVREALERLQASGNDEDARALIRRLGPRAVPELRDRLRQIVSGSQPDPTFEQLVHDLLKLAAPQWDGYAPNASTAEKLQALDNVKL